MSQSSNPPTPNQLPSNATMRAHSFMLERRSSGTTDDDGNLIMVNDQDLPDRRAQISAYRQLQAQHNPTFSSVNVEGGGSSGSGSGVANMSGNVDNGVLIGEDEPDDLLSGHFYPIGASALLGGQPKAETTVSGRVTALSIGPNGNRVYAGSANGGVWRSDDAGNSWRPLMNALHFAPTTQQSDSLAIGAVAMDPVQNERIFVGTGEGPGSAAIAGSPKFFGVGPLYSPDGGFTWQEESVGEVRLDGSAFFKMVLDPVDSNLVTAASRHGVLRRMPRNSDLKTDFKPQAYFFRFTPATEALSSYYWSEDGRDTARAWSGGGGYLEKNVFLTPFSFSGMPFILQYVADTGEVAINLWQGDGSPSAWISVDSTNWGKGWTHFLPVTLMGKSYMVSYNENSGLATLWFLDISLNLLLADITPVWKNRKWGAGWTTFVPLNIMGQPFFIAYNYKTAAVRLQRWLPNGQNIPVISSNWVPNLRLMPFNIKDGSYLLRVKATDGSGDLLRFDEAGRFDVVNEFGNKTFTPSINLQLNPFNIGDSARFFTYDYNSGNMNAFIWKENLDLETAATQFWNKGLIVKSFVMGYEWVEPEFDPKPKPSPNLSGPKTPTASSLAYARQANKTHYYAAFWDDQVYRSIDGGATWAVLGNGFPSKAGRITLACQETNQAVLYAFVEAGGVYRWDSSDNKWRQIEGVPAKADLVASQGNYDLSIIVSPADIDTIYLGGAGKEKAAAIYRCKVTYQTGVIYNSITMVPTWIGESVHADIHDFAFSSGNADHLWLGCDGGVFKTNQATSTNSADFPELFDAKNCGLGTQTINFLEQHPTEDAILFCGTQDNGGQRMIGGEAWNLSSYGDSGHVLVDWSEPKNLFFSYIRNDYSTNTNGGKNPGNNKAGKIPGVSADNTLGYPPFAGTPAQAGSSQDSRRIAYGSNKPWLNDSFGTDQTAWKALTPNALGRGDGFRIKTLVFVTPAILLIGCMNGQVFKLTEVKQSNSVSWKLLRLDNTDPKLGVSGPITAIAPDPSDQTNSKFYVAVGGSIKNYRRVWYFDGKGWEQTSGPGTGHFNALLDIQYNALVAVEIEKKVQLFAGADIGIWHSQDQGAHWRPFSVGLPEAGVFDLKVFPENKALNSPWLLRAATYGRSVYERVLDGGTMTLKESLEQPVQLYISTNAVDRGLYPAVTRSVPGYVTRLDETDIRQSVDMKMKRSANGVFAMPAIIDFCQFQQLPNENFKTFSTIKARYYCRVHTRGLATADNVVVRLLMVKVADQAEPMDSAPNPPDLPDSLPQSIQKKTAIKSGTQWVDLGSETVNGLFAGTPKVTSIEFNIALPGSYYVLAILNQAGDLFKDKEKDPLKLTSENRKVAMSYFIM